MKAILKMRKGFSQRLLLNLLLFIVILNRPLSASIEMWQVVDCKSLVFINFSSNHGYYSGNILFEYRHEIGALDYVRNTLVQEEKIKDLPILIVLPEHFFAWRPGVPGWLTESSSPQISIEKNGFILRGEEGEDSSNIGPCYVIYMHRREQSYEKLLLLTLALQFLKPEKEKIKVSDISEFKKILEEDLAEFSNISLRLDPVPSPDGKFVVYAAWRDGVLGFELLSPLSKSVRKLKPLEGYLASLPLWSADSRYLIYASLREIKVFDTRHKLTTAIPYFELLKKEHKQNPSVDEIVLSFETSTGELWFSAAYNTFGGWYVWKYNLRQKKTTLIGHYRKKPVWSDIWEKKTQETRPDPTMDASFDKAL